MTIKPYAVLLGRLLFSQDDIHKSVRVISGGEQGRMVFGKLILQKNNIKVMDEPTILIWNPSNRSIPRWKTIPAP